MALRSVRILSALAVGCLMTAALAACTHQQSMAQLSERPEGFGLFYNDQGERASLAYGQPNSDNVGLMLQCQKGAGRVQVSDTVRAELGQSLVLTSGRQTSELLSRVEDGESGAPQMVMADTTTEAQALKAFRKSGKISVKYGKIGYDVTASREEQAGVELFFSVCGKPTEV